jgi:hypothetical protein
MSVGPTLTPAEPIRSRDSAYFIFAPTKRAPASVGGSPIAAICTGTCLALPRRPCSEPGLCLVDAHAWTLGFTMSYLPSTGLLWVDLGLRVHNSFFDRRESVLFPYLLFSCDTIATRSLRTPNLPKPSTVDTMDTPACENNGKDNERRSVEESFWIYKSTRLLASREIITHTLIHSLLISFSFFLSSFSIQSLFLISKDTYGPTLLKFGIPH